MPVIRWTGWAAALVLFSFAGCAAAEPMGRRGTDAPPASSLDAPASLDDVGTADAGSVDAGASALDGGLAMDGGAMSDVPSIDAGSDAPSVGTDAGVVEIPWFLSAIFLDCSPAGIGTRYSYSCPPGGSESPIWGTDLYTTDSSICVAAVHAGRISLAAGGMVSIEVRPGAASYSGSTRNGITSDSWGAWDCSFAF